MEDDLHGGGGVVGRGLPRAAVALQAAHEPAVRGQVNLREQRHKQQPPESTDTSPGFASNEITTLGFHSCPREKEVFPYSSAIVPLDLSFLCLYLTFTESKSL